MGAQPGLRGTERLVPQDLGSTLGEVTMNSKTLRIVCEVINLDGAHEVLLDANVNVSSTIPSERLREIVQYGERFVVARIEALTPREPTHQEHD